MTQPRHFSGELSELLAPDELAAVQLMRDRYGIDAVRTYQFWERITARLLDGDLTPAGHPYDVLCGTVRVEVKYSQEFPSPPRQVMKWTGLRGERRTDDVTVLYGVDADDRLYVWVAPSVLLGRTISITSPRVRVGDGRSGLDQWHVPFDQVLPAVLSAAACAEAHGRL